MTVNKAEECRNIRVANFGNDPLNPHQLSLMVDEVKLRVQNIKRELYEIGRILTEAREIIPYGGFKDWIESNFDFSYQTANNFMNVYQCCLGRPQLVADFKPSLLYILTAPKFQENIRELFFKYATFFLNIGNKAARDIAIKYSNGEYSLDHPEVKALIKYLEDQDSYEVYNNGLERNIRLVSDLHETVTKTVKDISWPTIEGDQKTQMTNNQHQKVADHIQEMVAAVESILPECKIVEHLEPQIKTKKLKRRIFRKSKF